MRRLLCIFLMLLLPMHAFSMQGGAFAFEKMFDIAHEVDHIGGISHHHHHHHDGHGTTHYDESGESAKHFAEHASSHLCVALPSGEVSLFTNAQFRVARSDLGQFIPDHIPESPQRPPQSSLG